MLLDVPVTVIPCVKMIDIYDIENCTYLSLGESLKDARLPHVCMDGFHFRHAWGWSIENASEMVAIGVNDGG